MNNFFTKSYWGTITAYTPYTVRALYSIYNILENLILLCCNSIKNRHSAALPGLGTPPNQTVVKHFVIKPGNFLNLESNSVVSAFINLGFSFLIY